MLKLNLGCGEDIREGYDNIDIRELPGCIRANVCDLPYGENSVDEILASDVYEHISHRKALDLLKHWYSILKPGGVLVLRAPCLDTILMYLATAKNEEQIEEGIRMIFGGQEYEENSHKNICQTKIITRQLEEIGFVNVTHSFNAQNIILTGSKNDTV